MNFIQLNFTAQIFSVLAFFLSFPISAHAEGTSCASVYNNAVLNVSVRTQERSSKSFYFNLYCEQSGETKSFTSSAEFGFPIEGIPLNISGNGNWDETQLKEFCQVNNSENFFSSSDLTFGSFVVTDALASFNECRALETKGLIITHQEAPPNSFTLFGEFRSATTDATIDSIEYDATELFCRSTNFTSDGSAELIDGSKSLDPEKENFNISCMRTKHNAGGRDFFKRTTFQISTSLGPYTVVLPGDANLGFNLASQAMVAHDALMVERNRAIAELNATAARLRATFNATQGTIKLIYVGDNILPADVHLPCGADHNVYLPTICGAGSHFTSAVLATTRAGGACGHSHYAVSCMPNQ